MLVHTDAGSKSAVLPLSKLPAAVEKQLNALKDSWSQRLNENPSLFGKIELEVHQQFQQLADQVVAGLLAEAGQQPSLDDACKKSC
jgi:hypothetical protein